MNIEEKMTILNDIKMPTDMQNRIVMNCRKERMKNMESKRIIKRFHGKPMVAFVTLALCVCLMCGTVIAATDKGFFKDVKRWNGAVVGTAYEQATDEVNVSVVNIDNILTLQLSFVDATKPPYNCSEQFGINSFKILDKDGDVILKSEEPIVSNVIDGCAEIQIEIDELNNGTYSLVIAEMVSEKKADQPLILHGNWVVDFEK